MPFETWECSYHQQCEDMTTFFSTVSMIWRKIAFTLSSGIKDEENSTDILPKKNLRCKYSPLLELQLLWVTNNLFEIHKLKIYSSTSHKKFSLSSLIFQKLSSKKMFQNFIHFSFGIYICLRGRFWTTSLENINLKIFKIFNMKI